MVILDISKMYRKLYLTLICLIKSKILKKQAQKTNVHLIFPRAIREELSKLWKNNKMLSYYLLTCSSCYIVIWSARGREASAPATPHTYIDFQSITTITHDSWINFKRQCEMPQSSVPSCRVHSLNPARFLHKVGVVVFTTLTFAEKHKKISMRGARKCDIWTYISFCYYCVSVCMKIT